MRNTAAALVRLRGIGGLIVVDFIHLTEPEHVKRVLEVLSVSISRDHTPTQVSPMSEFGLVEITRKRVRDPLVKLMSECCRTCAGDGRKRTRDSVAPSVAACMAAIELVDDRYADYRSLGTPTLIADDFFHVGCVLAPEVTEW